MSGLNFNTMTDDELAKLDVVAMFEEAEASKQKEEEAAVTVTDPVTTEEVVEPEAVDATDDAVITQEEGTQEETEVPAEDTTTEETTTPPETLEIDYKTEYERLFAPIKADNREIKINSIDEIISLVQKGVNYNNRSRALKEKEVFIKTLENNGLLDKDKLNFLVDISKKDTKAIEKLIKDSGIDILSIDQNQEVDYKPTNHTPNVEEITRIQYFEDLRATEEGSRVLKDTGNTSLWDESSVNAAYKDPTIMGHLAHHNKLGYYDIILDELARRQALGYPMEPTFLSNYVAIGTELDKAGKLSKAPAQQVAPTNVVQQTKVVPKLTVSNDDKLKAIQSPSGKPAKANPLIDADNLSDEEFNKAFSKTFGNLI